MNELMSRTGFVSNSNSKLICSKNFILNCTKYLISRPILPTKSKSLNKIVNQKQKISYPNHFMNEISSIKLSESYQRNNLNKTECKVIDFLGDQNFFICISQLKGHRKFKNFISKYKGNNYISIKNFDFEREINGPIQTKFQQRKITSCPQELNEDQK